MNNPKKVNCLAFITLWILASGIPALTFAQTPASKLLRTPGTEGGLFRYERDQFVLVGQRVPTQRIEEAPNGNLQASTRQCWSKARKDISEYAA